MPPEVGASAVVRATVTDADTAIALGSGDVSVLGTPRVLALLEAATVAAVHGSLDAGLTTVGVRVEVDHLTSSRVGAQVRAEATLSETKGRRLLFRVRLLDGDRLAAAGLVTRAMVDRSAFGG